MPPSVPSSTMRHQLYAARTDAALIESLRKDDRQAFAEIYERYWQRLLEAAYRRLHSREAAEEAVQDVFVSLWHKRREVMIQQLPNYLLTAVKYRVIDALKLQMSRTTYLDRALPQLTTEDRSTEETVAADDLSGALLQSLLQLPEHTREVFRLSRLEHQSVPEIAEKLHISRKTVEYHLTRALKVLRVSLRDFLLLLILLRWWE